MANDKKKPSIASQGAVMRRVLRYIGPHVSLVVLSLALCLISVALTLYVPILVGRAVDCIVGPNAVDFAALKPILLTIAVCIVVTAAAQWLMNALHNRITYDTVRDIRRDAFAHIQNLPLSYLDAHPTGDTVSRMIADVDTFADGLLMGFTQLFSGVMTILGTLGFMLTLSAPITLLVVLITPLSLLVANFIAKRTYAMFRLQSVTRGEQTALIDEAIGEHQFKAYYQPKCNPKTGEIVGGEALVRWVQEDGTMLPPDRFIPLFEKNGAIGKLDEYMFTCVCAQLSQWRREGLEIRPVSVNLSRASLCRQGVALAYKRILEGYGLSTWMVPLEVTESAMISDDAVISVLQEFYRYGFRIEIDDFGKAQSTLPMLKLPFVDTVKLDKSLIDCIGDRKGEIMLRQVVRLCYELGLYTTAEGVEAEDQVDFLRALDCTDIQGYFFSPPLPVEKYTEKLRQQARKRA